LEKMWCEVDFRSEKNNRCTACNSLKNLEVINGVSSPDFTLQ